MLSKNVKLTVFTRLEQILLVLMPQSRVRNHINFSWLQMMCSDTVECVHMDIKWGSFEMFTVQDYPINGYFARYCKVAALVTCETLHQLQKRQKQLSVDPQNVNTSGKKRGKLKASFILVYKLWSSVPVNSQAAFLLLHLVSAYCRQVCRPGFTFNSKFAASLP